MAEAVIINRTALWTKLEMAYKAVFLFLVAQKFLCKFSFYECCKCRNEIKLIAFSKTEKILGIR